MARPNLLSPNEFDSRGYRRPTPDDLIDMLQHTPGSMSRGASSANDSGTPPGGLLGRWLELQAAQEQPRSIGEDRELMPSAPATPNFRLVRISPPVQPHGAVGASNRPSYSTLGDGNQPDVLPTSHWGSGESGADAGRPAPVIAGFSRIGRAVPMPPMGPGTLPKIPMPEWWSAIRKLLQLYPKMSSGLGGGGGDEGCKEERREAREICTDAFADGWKSNYGVGPYKTPPGKRWTIEDCMRGLISERCGGNATDK